MMGILQITSAIYNHSISIMISSSFFQKLAFVGISLLLMSASLSQALPRSLSGMDMHPSTFHRRLHQESQFQGYFISSGGFISCALVSGVGEASCWGSPVPEVAWLSPTLLEGGVSFKSISCGGNFCCGVQNGTETVWCFGVGSDGQLGTGNTSSSTTPVPAQGGEAYSFLSCGELHCCGILAETGRLKCWGGNALNQLAQGSVTRSTTPVLIQDSQNKMYSQVASGHFSTCALAGFGGEAWCWGANWRGQLGDGTKNDSSKPVLVKGGYSFRMIGCGWNHCCASTSAGDAYCWGRGEEGQLGDGTNTDKSTPTLVKGGHTFSFITSSGNNSCGLIRDLGKGMCWGEGTSGQLGNGSFTNKNIPTAVQGNSAFQQITAGGYKTCGVKSDNSAVCFGGNTDGAKPYSFLGIGASTPDKINIPTPVDSTEEFGASSGTIPSPSPSPSPPPPPPVSRPPPPPRSPTQSPPQSSKIVPSPSPTPTASKSSDDSSSDTAAIIGGAVGGAILLILIAVAAVFLIKKRNRQQEEQNQSQNFITPATRPDFQPPPNTNTFLSNWTNTGNNSAVYATREAPYYPVLPPPPADSTPRAAAGNSSEDALRDPLLSWAHSNASQSPRPTSPSRASSGNISYDEIEYMDLDIKERLGYGSFGAAYLAIYNLTPVAVKILMNPHLAHTAQTEEYRGQLLEDLHKEATLMASPGLRHPNIIQMMGVCNTPPCIVTEYCPRGSLTKVLGNCRAHVAGYELSWSRRVSMALDAAKGMLHLHTRLPPVIHRDLKSPNLLVTENWHVKVADFNLSKLMPEDGLSLGSLQLNTRGGGQNALWLSPENLRGDPSTAATDVFAFGVIMWELLTASIPWTGTSQLQVAMKVMNNDRLAVPSALEVFGLEGQQLPGYDQYVDLLQQCWAQEKGSRPTFRYIAAILTELLAQHAGN